MKEIIEHYSGAILAFFVTLALLGVLAYLLLGGGPVAQAFQGMIDGFLQNAQSAPVAVPTTPATP